MGNSNRFLGQAAWWLLFVFGAFFSAASHADPITVIYERSVIGGAPGVDQGLPFLLDDPSTNPNSIRLRFFVPDFAYLSSINSIKITARVFDDVGSTLPGADADGTQNRDVEQVFITFILNDAGLFNLDVACACGAVFNGTTEAAPLVLPGEIDPFDLADAADKIQDDGVFFIRVSRRGGDFFVQGATVEIDGILVPAPHTLALLALGLGLMLFSRAHRSGAVRAQRY